MGAVTTWLMAKQYRTGEAIASSWLADHISGKPVWTPTGQSVIFVGRPVQLGFEVTPACSSMIISLVFLLGSALLAVFAPRFRLRRILIAFAVALVLAVAVNVARVFLIVLASSEWSRGIGFGLSHEYVGSILTVFGMAFAFLVYLFLLARDRTAVSAG